MIVVYLALVRLPFNDEAWSEEQGAWGLGHRAWSKELGVQRKEYGARGKELGF